jgi:hypothetical protein
MLADRVCVYSTPSVTLCGRSLVAAPAGAYDIRTWSRLVFDEYHPPCVKCATAVLGYAALVQFLSRHQRQRLAAYCVYAATHPPA